MIKLADRVRGTVSIESLESRTLLSESASAQLHLLSTAGTPAQPIYHYDITLTNTGTTDLGTFWFAWVPGENFLPTVPVAESSPAGWGSLVTGSGNSSDGSAIQWVAQPSTPTILPGKTLGGFDFTSADSPAALAGKSPQHPQTSVMTSFVYGAGPFSDAGAELIVAPIAAPVPAASKIQLTASAATVTVGSNVTFTAKVASATAGGATPTGTVTFKDGATTIGSAAVNADGSAVLTTSFLALGAHKIAASYGGSTAYLSSSSTALTETVNEPPALNTTVSADIALINAEFGKFETSFISGANTLVTDAATIKTDDTEQATAIAPLVSKLDTDVKNVQTALQADKLADSSLIVTEETTIRGQETKVIQDKANAMLEAADKATLKTERIKLQSDLLAQLNARISTRQQDESSIVADANNLVTTIGAGSHATTALQAAVSKFVNDKTSIASVLTADIDALLSDRTKLTTDLTAEQSS